MLAGEAAPRTLVPGTPRRGDDRGGLDAAGQRPRGRSVKRLQGTGIVVSLFLDRMRQIEPAAELGR